MGYTSKEIATVLWNTFNLEAEAIELTSDNDGCYKFNVFPTEDTKLGTLSDMAQELYDSGLFDVTMLNDHLEIEFLNPFVLERKQFSMIYENVTKWISFDDAQIKNLKSRFQTRHEKYRMSEFFKLIMKQLDDKKKLSSRQFDQLKYLLDHGRTMYEAGILSTKN